MNMGGLIRGSHEARCLPVDDGAARVVMLALFTAGNADALLSLNPDAARDLAHQLRTAADQAESDEVVASFPVTRMGSA